MARRMQAPPTSSEEELAKRLEDALKLLNTPVGRALLRDGTTLRRWSNSVPANYWVESKTGRMLFHSDRDNPRCPVMSAYASLRPFLVLGAAHGGSEEVGRLGPEIIAEHTRRKLSKVAKRALAKRAPSPTRKF